jgi:sarcosine/dimethylglycine N-methyltransferase
MNMQFNQILDQYDSEQGLKFYRVVMGDFQDNIHYGIYYKLHDPMSLAAEQTISFLVDLVETRGSIQNRKAVDLGSGNGGAAHYLAQKHGWEITCVNLGNAQNKLNKQQAVSKGISQLIHVTEHDFEHLPEEWTAAFDLVWSQEAFCHANNKKQVLREAERILAPGGIFVFTDIMSGEEVDEKAFETFSDRNAISGLAKATEYIRWCSSNHFQDLTYYDLTKYLPMNFEKMIDQIDRYKEQMVGDGVSEKYLDDFRQSLVKRISAAREKSFCWGAFLMVKPLDMQPVDLAVLIGGSELCEVPVLPLSSKNMESWATVFLNSEWKNINVPLQQWVSKTGRPVSVHGGRGKIVQGEMDVFWESATLHASNKAINYECKDIASRDQSGRIYIEWFNCHEDGGQAFYCPGKKLLYLLAPPTLHPKPQDFKAYLADGSQGVLIKPGVWHSNPIPLIDDTTRVITRQSDMNATVDCRLLEEFNCWLSINPLNQDV